MNDTRYTTTCPACGKTFRPYKKKPRTYCCQACYLADRNPSRACPTCGKEFTAKRNRGQIYCSVACNPGRKPRPENYVTKSCPVCGKEFTFHKSWPLKTCSLECRDAGKRVETTCPECGKAFTYHRSWPRKFCSRACAGKHSVKNIKSWRPSVYTATCQQCGQEFEATPKRSRGRFCSKQCSGAWKAAHGPRGEEHPNWRGGYLPYYGANWRQQRRAARRRDNYTCQRCGITEEELGRHLDVHHIRRFADFTDYRDANAVANLICLCPKCHTATEWSTNR